MQLGKGQDRRQRQMFMAKNREATKTEAKTNYLTKTLNEGMSGAAPMRDMVMVKC